MLKITNKFRFISVSYSLFFILILCIILNISCHGKSNPVNVNNNSKQIERVEGSPYPVSQQPDKLFVVEDKSFSEQELLTLQTLQGILAQKKPFIYRFSENNSQWLLDLQQNYGVIFDYTYFTDLKGLVEHFKSEIDGYILCSPTQPSVHVAVSLAGLKKSIVVTSVNEADIKSTGLNLVEDVRDKDMLWFLKNYENEYNRNYLCFQRLGATGFLADYASFGNAMYFFDELNSPVTNLVFSQMKPNSAMLGWGDGDEYQLIRKASEYSIFTHPADYAQNLSTFSNFSTEARQAKHSKDVDSQENVHTVCFLMSDGDNIQWILNAFYTDSRWFGSPRRSKVKIGWTIPPAMCELVPTVLKKIYDSADQSDKGRDYFVAGPSGTGYMFPDLYPDIQGYANLLDAFMEKADLKIVNVMGNTENPVFLEPILKQPHVDAIFFYYYADYAGGQGVIRWINDKPVITGRYKLWGGFETPATIAEKINELPRDIHSPQGYSLIPVHNWSNGVDEILECVDMLKEDVRIVTPDEFVALVKANITH